MGDSDIVFPGDELGVAEQFMPGSGTYEEDGKVYAARLGEAHLDPSAFTAEVRPKTTTPLEIEEGDVVIGRVSSLRKSFVSIDVEAEASQPDRDPITEASGTLHISKISPDYIDQIEDAFRIGDIVRARVIEVEPSIQLLTKDDELGVLLARCPKCRTVMEAKGEGLVCPDCDWKSRAKLAADYGTGNLLPPDNVDELMEERSQAQREHGIDFPPRPTYSPGGDGRGG
jgi:exosome complex component CSL4